MATEPLETPPLSGARSSRRGSLAALVLWASACFSAAPAFADHLAFQHAPPLMGDAGRDLEIVGTIANADDIAKARCRYRQKGGSWKQVDLALEYGDFYRATIPGREVVPPSIEYYCVGIDYFGAQTELFASQSAPRRVRITGEARAPIEDDGGEAKGNDGDKPDEGDKKPDNKKPPEDKNKGGGKTAGNDGGGKTGGQGSQGSGDVKLTGGGNKPEVKKRPVETPAAEESALFGGEDVVTLATRQAQSVSDAPAFASGVSEEQIRQLGLRTLPDVLKTIPGYETSRDVEGFNRVAIRGIRDDAALLVLYDGHKLNSPYDARAILAVPTENVERVEVIRGPGSALYGAGAFLGVVNMVSKRREGSDVALSAGSFGTVDGHATVGTPLSPDVMLFGDIDASRSDGYRRDIKSDSLSSILEAAGRKQEDQNAGITNDASKFLNLGSELRFGGNGGATTKLAARFIHQDRGALVGLFDAVGPGSQLKWDVFLADVSHEIPLSGGSLTMRGWFDHQAANRLFQIAPPNYPITTGVTAPNGLYEQTKFTAQTAGAEANLALTLGSSNKLSVGLNAELDRLPSYSYGLNFEGRSTVFDAPQTPSTFVARQADPFLNKRFVAGAYLQDVLKIGNALAITGGVRADVTQLPTYDATLSKTTGTAFIPAINPRVGMVLNPTEGLSFKVLYGRAFRAPTLQELAEKLPSTDFSQGRFEGNPGLRPATIDTVEAGVETVSALKDSKVRVRANGFFNNFNDLISAIDKSGNITPLSNEKDAVRVFGVESELRFEVTARAYTFMNYSWFRAIDYGAPEGFRLLTDVPQYRFNWALALPVGRYLNVSILAQLGAERRNNGRSTLENIRHFDIPAYSLVGAQLRTEPIADAVEIAVTGQNVFNYDLRDDVPRPDRLPSLLPREGLAAFATVRVKF